MEQTEAGSIVVNADEMRVLRAGLFVAIHHGDSIIQADMKTITGHNLDEFQQLMWQIDEFNGHNDEVRRWYEDELRDLAGLSGTELEVRSQNIRDLVDRAEKHGVDVPPTLRAVLRTQG